MQKQIALPCRLKHRYTDDDSLIRNFVFLAYKQAIRTLLPKPASSQDPPDDHDRVLTPQVSWFGAGQPRGPHSALETDFRRR
jgi:hypothetical protein